MLIYFHGFRSGRQSEKIHALLQASDLGRWAIGFITGFLCVRWLLRYISRRDFTVFAWYRIAFGVLILVTWQMNWVVWADH
ncbi:MAG TPA: undecaprenyl-diphosphate phosphatase [Rhodocyclaceae bacterium]|nr:undecaprenyl-diphosphate phosphatase [Rhodocyclaceae bacterium]